MAVILTPAKCLKHFLRKFLRTFTLQLTVLEINRSIKLDFFCKTKSATLPLLYIFSNVIKPGMFTGKIINEDSGGINYINFRNSACAYTFIKENCNLIELGRCRLRIYFVLDERCYFYSKKKPLREEGGGRCVTVMLK